MSAESNGAASVVTTPLGKGAGQRRKKRATKRKQGQLGLSFIDLQGVSGLVEAYWAGKIPFVLVGRPGTGKTTLLRDIAGGEEHLVTAIGTDLSPSDLLGRYRMIGTETKWFDGILPLAMASGQTFYLDELGGLSPACFTILHSVLDGRRQLEIPACNKTVPAHPEFRFVASTNHCESSLDHLPRELRDRFAYIPVQPLSADVEVDLLVERSGVSREQAKFLVKYAEVTRQVNEQNGASTRQLLNAANVLAGGVDRDTAAFTSIAMPIAGSSRQAAKTLVSALRAEGFNEIDAWEAAMGPARDKHVQQSDGETWS